MTRPISLTIHQKALRHNLERMRKTTRGRTLWAVVKANAYGHGLANAVKAFAEADGLCTIEVCDAQKLRDLGWKKRILMLEGFFDEADVHALERLGIEPVIHSDWQIELLRTLAPFKDLKVHVKVNSGMNRLGWHAEAIAGKKAELAAIPGVTVLGEVTHFANGERTDNVPPASVACQLANMQGYATDGSACMANTAAALFHPEVTGTGVRAGIALYGISPDPEVSEEELGIEPAQTLSARILAIQNLVPGDAVGYGSRWVATRPCRIAVVACGYADGYPRCMPDGAPTWVCGKEAPITGAVSMDMLEIDVTDIPEAQVGSMVELWGKHIHANRLAKLAGTIGYELVCSPLPRVPVFVDEEI